MRSTCVLLFLLLSTATLGARAQLASEPLKIFPAAPVADRPFLLLVEDAWLDGCGGAVSMTVSTERIQVVSKLASPDLDVACTAVLLAFKQVLNPRAAAPEVDFGEQVTIEYFYDAGTGPELRASRTIAFGEGSLPPTTVQTGGWVTPELESSGLFIDQQGETLTALLAEYDANGQATWYYGAGRVNGSAFSARLESFGEIVCVTEPCDRAAPADGGRVDIILRDRDELVVAYDGVLTSGRVNEDQAFVYSRLRFERAEALSELAVPIPDLTGRWVAGVGGVNGRPDDYRSVEIAFDRVTMDGGIPRFVYRATPLDDRDDETRAFEVVCADERPVDGIRSCKLAEFAYAEGDCRASFEFAAAGYARVRAAASCDNTFVLETRFDMFRLD